MTASSRRTSTAASSPSTTSNEVFTNALVGGWRPAQDPFMTAVITMRDHPLGTEFTAHVMHRNATDRKVHEELGFYDGWGTVTAQLATHAEHQAEQAAGDAVVRGDRRSLDGERARP